MTEEVYTVEFNTNSYTKLAPNWLLQTVHNERAGALLQVPEDQRVDVVNNRSTVWRVRQHAVQLFQEPEVEVLSLVWFSWWGDQLGYSSVHEMPALQAERWGKGRVECEQTSAGGWSVYAKGTDFQRVREIHAGAVERAKRIMEEEVANSPKTS